jgi:hypothetical protein
MIATPYFWKKPGSPFVGGSPRTGASTVDADSLTAEL